MDREPAPSPLSRVDLALLHAAKAWGVEDTSGLWSRFPADRRSSLRWGWENVVGDAESSRDRLRREHAAQARPDLSRVHSSWWVRAIETESPSVRRAVAAHLPDGLAGAFREGLGLSTDDLDPDRPAHPGALGIALSLWADRLVGDLPDREDDPPAVAALTRFDAPTIARLFQTSGLAKWAMTGLPLPDLDRRDGERVAPLRILLAGIDPRFLVVAGSDVQAHVLGDPNALARLGMISFARLLRVADPYRVRWSLQHLPYSTAKTLRNLIGAGARKAPMLARWENEILRASWTRLHDEGRISEPWRSSP